MSHLRGLLPNVSRLPQNINNRCRTSPLLRRLTRRASTPCKYQTVAREAACDIQETGEVSGGDIQRRNGNDESYDRDSHGDDDVPATFIDPVAVVRHGESDQGADKIWWSSTDEGDGVGA